MTLQKINNNKAIDKLSKYICTFAYIGLYPFVARVVTHYFGHKYRFLDLYSDTLFFIFFGLSYIFIPAVLWLLTTKIFKKIHTAITIIYFSLFIIWQFIMFLAALFLWLIDGGNEPIFEP